MEEDANPIKTLLRRSVVWDNHGCLPLTTDASYLPQLARYRRAGVHVVSINVGYANQSLLEHLRVLSFMRQWIAQRPETYQLVSTVEEVRQCKAAGRLGIVFDVEGMGPVLEDCSFVQTFYELGVRWMLIAYNRNNAAGGGCMDVDGGLTALGRRVIDEMQRVGMVLCVSHAGARTAAEAIEYSSNPVIFSHSNPSGDVAHPRNISDAVMRACAEKGGVVGLSGIGAFLGSDEQLIERLLRQLRYVIDRIGPQHVGLGLDYVFDRDTLNANVRRNPALYPPGVAGNLQMLGPESIEAIAEGLARDSLTDAHIGAILGGNWLRIAARVWR